MPLLIFGLWQATCFNMLDAFFRHFTSVREKQSEIHQYEAGPYKIGDRIVVGGREYEVIGFGGERE